jgi:DNA (cytosine-5)-methyltransferase 1
MEELAPLLFENHGIDSRYTGPHDVAPTMSARYGTGGNNVPLVSQEVETYCIMGNAIDREPHNGGNGIGYQEGVAYTLTATDHHAVFSRQRVDVFCENDVVSTQSARQHKDATDLVCQQAEVNVDEQEEGDEGDTNAPAVFLIRRLTPTECERLQGFPDGWTDIPGASDSARYKALGNSVAIPCVDFIMRGIACVLDADTPSP